MNFSEDQIWTVELLITFSEFSVKIHVNVEYFYETLLTVEFKSLCSWFASILLGQFIFSQYSIA